MNFYFLKTYKLFIFNLVLIWSRLSIQINHSIVSYSDTSSLLNLICPCFSTCFRWHQPSNENNFNLKQRHILFKFHFVMNERTNYFLTQLFYYRFGNKGFDRVCYWNFNRTINVVWVLTSNNYIFYKQNYFEKKNFSKFSFIYLQES